jgi:hypothetical protein
MQNALKIVAAIVIFALIGVVTYQGTVYQIEHPELIYASQF